MKSDLFLGLRVQKLVAHKIFQRTDGKEKKPSCGNHLIALPDDGIDSLQNRVMKALGGGSQGVAMDIANTDADRFFDIATKLLSDADKDFVDRSKKLATLLHESQKTRDLPGGALAVMRGITGQNKNRFVGVIKAEVHDGFNFPDEDDNEPSMEYLSSLMLTPAQRLYKVGLLIEKENVAGKAVSPDNYLAFLYDDNYSAGTHKGAAQYYYDSFLGFSHKESAKRSVKDFFEQSRAFFNSCDISTEQKLDLYGALHSELKVNKKTTVSVKEFAAAVLPDELQDKYLAFMESKGVPVQSFAKDISLIESKLKRRSVKFSSEVTISAPADAFGKLVVVDKEHSNDQITVVRIKGKVTAEQ